jgi:hypothetical protein
MRKVSYKGRYSFVKDMTETFDDHFLCRRTTCKLKQVKNWSNLFVNLHNDELDTLN